MHRPTKKQYIQSVKVISLLVITLLFCISQKGYSKPKVNSRLLVKSLLQDTLKQQQDTTLSIKDSSILVLDSTLSAISKDTLVRPDSISLAKLIELTIQDEYEMVEELYDSLMVASNYKLVPLD